MALRISRGRWQPRTPGSAASKESAAGASPQRLWKALWLVCALRGRHGCRPTTRRNDPPDHAPRAALARPGCRGRQPLCRRRRHGRLDEGRKEISRIASRLAKGLVPEQLRDPMSGFFVMKSEALRDAAHRLRVTATRSSSTCSSRQAGRCGSPRFPTRSSPVRTARASSTRSWPGNT